MKYGLPAATIEKMRAVLARFPHVERAVLYGSRAKGNFKTGSDIDLTLFGEDLDSAQLSKIAETLDDLLLPYTIDLSIYAELNHAKLREHIDRVGVVFYERGGAGQHQGAAMKKGWQTKTIGEVCDVINGGTPKTGVPEYWDGNHRWITPAEMDKRFSPYVSDTERKISDLGLRDSSARMLPPNSVILSSRAPIGHLVINTEPMGTNQGCKGLIPRSQIEHKFLYYYLSSIVDLLNSLGTGATFKELSGGKLKEVTIPIPPLPEQQRIVGLLDETFAGLATAQANAEKNLQNARALFESHLQSVFAQRGPGWVEMTLDKISTNLDSKRVPITKNVRTSGEYPYYGASGIVDYVDNYIFEGDNLLVSEDGANLLARSTPIAFSVSGKYWVNNHAHILHFEDMATQRFAEFYLENIKLDDYITGAAQPKLNQKALNSIPIPIPMSVEAQAKIVESVESLQQETQRLASIYSRKLAALEALKKSLLHQAFAGEL